MSVSCNGGMSEESRGDVRNLGHYLYVSWVTHADQERLQYFGFTWTHICLRVSGGDLRLWPHQCVAGSSTASLRVLGHPSVCIFSAESSACGLFMWYSTTSQRKIPTNQLDMNVNSWVYTHGDLPESCSCWWAETSNARVLKATDCLWISLVYR
jgi:hypothetical protein